MKIQKTVIMGELIDEDTHFTFLELCHVCGVSSDFVTELMAHGSIEPLEHIEEQEITAAKFDAVAIRRLRCAVRLHHQLQINMEGVAVVLDLLEELEELRKQLQLLAQK